MEIEVDLATHKGETRRYVPVPLEPIFTCIRRMTDCLPEIEGVEIRVSLRDRRGKFIRRFAKGDAGIFQMLQD
jgi:hypothetical protein